MSNSSAFGEIKLRPFTPLPVQTPAPVYYIPLGDGRSVQEWAAAVLQLFRTLQPASMIKRNQLVALKQHFGERGNNGYLKPELVAGLVQEVRGHGGRPLLIETNTLYKGSRSDSYEHLSTAYDHGFTPDRVGAPILICDGFNGQNQQAVAVPGKQITTAWLASDVFFFDVLVCLSHVKGHMMAGMGAALKNLAMGLSGRAGKLAQHADFRPAFDAQKCTTCGACVTWCPTDALALEEDDDHPRLASDTCIGCGECLTVCRDGAIGFDWNTPIGTGFYTKMTEYALAAASLFSGRAFYINVINHVSKHCDCMGEPSDPVAPDLGVVAGWDPLAVDRACYDLCQRAYGENIWEREHPQVKMDYLFQYAAEIGLGSLEYNLTELPLE